MMTARHLSADGVWEHFLNQGAATSLLAPATVWFPIPLFGGLINRICMEKGTRQDNIIMHNAFMVLLYIALILSSRVIMFRESVEWMTVNVNDRCGAVAYLSIVPRSAVSVACVSKLHVVYCVVQCNVTF